MQFTDLTTTAKKFPLTFTHSVVATEALEDKLQQMNVTAKIYL